MSKGNFLHARRRVLPHSGDVYQKILEKYSRKQSILWYLKTTNQFIKHVPGCVMCKSGGAADASPHLASIASTNSPMSTDKEAAVEVELIGSWTSQDCLEFQNAISTAGLDSRTIESRAIVGKRVGHTKVRRVPVGRLD